MKKFSLKDERVAKKMSSLVEGMVEDSTFMGEDPRKFFADCRQVPTWVSPQSLNMPQNQSETTPTQTEQPDPLLKGQPSKGETLILDGQEIYNPEYVYDVDLPIYKLPERTGDGYAPIQRDIDPQFSKGYAPGTTTKSEEKPAEAPCCMGDLELLEDVEVPVVNIIPEPQQEPVELKPEEVIHEDETVKEYLPSTPAWSPLLWK